MERILQENSGISYKFESSLFSMHREGTKTKENFTGFCVGVSFRGKSRVNTEREERGNEQKDCW